MLCFVGIGGLEILFILFVLGVTVVPQILVILYIMRSTLETNLKLIWVLVTIFVPFGWLVYLLAGRPKE
ncbi:PLDc N-terminal domain-containing protein [Runella sp.]|uniref:PLDc N-terminal domain-containing protein n=1 Tax=Runella sp. TaxID=1960881 RepID=UPI003D100FF7